MTEEELQRVFAYRGAHPGVVVFGRLLASEESEQTSSVLRGREDVHLRHHFLWHGSYEPSPELVWVIASDDLLCRGDCERRWNGTSSRHSRLASATRCDMKAVVVDVIARESDGYLKESYMIKDE